MCITFWYELILKFNNMSQVIAIESDTKERRYPKNGLSISYLRFSARKNSSLVEVGRDYQQLPTVFAREKLRLSPAPERHFLSPEQYNRRSNR